jgi:hypothetical protein
MQDNFDLTGYLRKNNKLLNENIGGYVDLKPVKEADGDKPMGMPETDADNPWMEEVDGTEAYTVGDWKCYYDYPGILIWSYKDVPFDQLAVYATPGFDGKDVTPIQVEINNETFDNETLSKGTFANFREYAAAMKNYLDQAAANFEGVDEGEDLGGWDGDGQHDQYDGEYDGETGPAIVDETDGLEEAKKPAFVIPAPDSYDIENDAKYIQSLLNKAGIKAKVAPDMYSEELRVYTNDEKMARKVIEKSGYQIGWSDDNLEELQKPEKIYADDVAELDYTDRMMDLGGASIEKGITDLIDDGFEPEDVLDMCKMFIDAHAGAKAQGKKF